MATLKPVAWVKASSLGLKVGQSGTIAVLCKSDLDGTLSARKIAYASAHPEIATVDSKGKVLGLAVGNTLVSVTSEGVSTAVIVTVRGVGGIQPPPTTSDDYFANSYFGRLI